MRTLAMHPLVVWLVFVAVHLWLGMLNLLGPNQPLGDVQNIYPYWIQTTLNGIWVGIDVDWVYPIVALVPMLLASVFGLENFAATWLTMILLLNVVAFGVLIRWGNDRSRLLLGWWWIAFLMLLGPIAIGRIDAVTVPVALMGMLVLSTRPRTAAVLLAVATWIKVWPAALVAAVVVADRRRWSVVLVGAAVSTVIVGVGLLLGGGTHLASFVTEQTGRGLQVEAPAATPFLWLALFGVEDVAVEYSREILTFQVVGSTTEAIAALATPVMAVLVAGILALGLLAVVRGSTTERVLPPLAVALVLAFIVTNKVGSPQFIAWLAVPVLYGLLVQGRDFRVPAIASLMLAVLTQAIYPFFYHDLLSAQPWMLVLITVRNLGEVVLLVWAIVAIVVVLRSTRVRRPPARGLNV